MVWPGGAISKYDVLSPYFKSKKVFLYSYFFSIYSNFSSLELFELIVQWILIFFRHSVISMNFNLQYNINNYISFKMIPCIFSFSKKKTAFIKIVIQQKTWFLKQRNLNADSLYRFACWTKCLLPYLSLYWFWLKVGQCRLYAD